jgi:HD superfamily phosphohydrolase
VTHEDISGSIILNELADLIIRIRRSPHGTFQAPISAKQVAKFIKMPEDFSKYSLWEQVFAKIMMGIYSADAMDFLLRDQYFCGTSEFGKINYRSLIDNSVITRNGLTLKKNALPAFRTFLQTRFNMFRHVYLYEKNELYDLAFGKLIPDVLRLLRLGNPYKNLSRFKKITDFGLHHIVPGWSNEKGEKGRIGREWRRMLMRREMPFVKVKEQENFYRTTGEVSSIIDKGIIKKEIRNKFNSYPDVKVMICRNDVRLQQQFMEFESLEAFRTNDNIKALGIINPNNGEFCTEEGNYYIKDIPLKYEVIRAYIPEDFKEDVGEPADEPQQGELFSGQSIAGDEAAMRSDKTSM